MGQRLVILKMNNMNLQEQINRIHEMMFEQENDSKINETDNTKKILFKLINREVKGADLYEHRGALWLIFTDEKKWVLFLGKSVGILNYNYNFFEKLFKYMSLDVVENQHYITEWVEDMIKNGVRFTYSKPVWFRVNVEDTIQNGTKIGNIKNE
jgi:hypothetical protein